MRHPNNRTCLTILLAIVTCGSCNTIRVPAVTYRLQGLVDGPAGHGGVRDARKRFAETFCGTLRHIVDSGETWGPCDQYIDIDSSVTPITAGPIEGRVRILVVAGVFSECLEADGVKAFLDAKNHLENPMYHKNISVGHISVAALGSSHENAKTIHTYVVHHPGDKFIAVGYSKGAGDWMEAIAAYPDVRGQTMALVTVAGSVAGSRLPDLFGPNLVKFAQDVLHSTGLPNCTVSDAGGLTSLTRRDRLTFLQTYPQDAVPSFSIAAVATDKTAQADRTISKVLRAPWQQLHAYSLDEDSQVIADDAVVPGGTLLAIARADHWAVALPFSAITDPEKRRQALRMVDRNTYPRVALLEAVVRFVLTP